MVKQLNLNNIIFKPFLSLAEYSELVKDCDIGIVSLTEKILLLWYQQNLVNYMGIVFSGC